MMVIECLTQRKAGLLELKGELVGTLVSSIYAIEPNLVCMF